MRKLALFISLLLTVTAHAQSSAVEVISIEQGLSQGFVSAVCQDREGLMWFATSNGLNRYDGYDFLVFKNDPYDPWSLSANNLSWVSEVGDFLFIVTEEQITFNLYHRKSQRFYKVPLSQSLEKQNLAWVIAENDHTVWICFITMQGKTLFRLRWPENLGEFIEKGTPEKVKFNFEAIPISEDLRDAGISADRKKMWILTEKGLHVRDLISGRTTPVESPPLRAGDARIVPDIAGATWVFQRDAMFRYDGKTWQSFSYGFPCHLLVEASRESGIAWFSTDDKVYGIDLKKAPHESVQRAVVHRLSIPERVRSGKTDQEGNVWFGTDARGIRKLNPGIRIFKNYLEGYSIYARPVVAPNSNNVLLGDVRRGPSFGGILDMTTGRIQPLKDLGIPFQPRVHAITDENGRYWLYSSAYSSEAAYSKVIDLLCFDPTTGQKTFYPMPKAFYAGSVVMDYRAPGQIWIANARQLVLFEIATKKFTVFDYDCAIEWTYPISMAAGADGVWWIGTDKGLLKGVPAGSRMQFSLLKNELSNRNGLPDNQIKSLLLDPDDPRVLWIGTGNRGLSRMDISQQRFTHYSTRNGLADDVIYGILADDEQPRNLWISTNRGLTRFTPKTGLFQYFFKSHGLQDDEFNTYAASKSASGQLFFGGVNGLTVFHPRDFKMSKNPPNLRITGLKINGTLVTPRDSASVLNADIQFTESLVLPYWKNSLSFHFAASDYTNSNRNQFAFYLEGTEAEWAHRGFEHTAQYLNLAPGTYTFRVKAANINGLWNETPVSLRFVIQPPWYRSWWAYVIYGLLLTGTAFSFYRIQLKRKLERTEAERLKEMDEFKSRFFTNISHEFRTPLTVILGTTEQLKTEAPQPMRDRLSLMKRSGESLLLLVNQVLDLAKLESNALKINYIQGNVPTYLSYITESLRSLANTRNVMLQVENKKPEIIMDYDPERLLQIVYNLLSNAIKFTPSGGKVTLKIDTVTATSGQHEETLLLAVTDTGIGVSEGDKPYLFDRFFQARNEGFVQSGGSGIGLSFTKELVKAMGGSISVESKIGLGSTFIVLLPIHRDAPLEPVQENANRYESQAHNTSSGLDQALPVKHADSGFPSLLLIEDNPDVVEYLRACLNPDYQLEFAYNGRAGIEKALEMIPDIIISDVMMPEKDGFQVCEALKYDERTSHIPIVLLTAKATVGDRITGLTRGADAYMAKPFHREELLATLKGLIELRQKLQRRYAQVTAAAPHSTDAALQIEDTFLQKLQKVVGEQFAEPAFSVENLCRAMTMSQPQLHRKLTALTGQNATQFIRRYRMEKALELLRAGENRISEVAYAVGFDDPKYFSRVFAETFGVPPSSWRDVLN